MNIVERSADFFIRGFPSLRMLIFGGPPFLLWAFLSLWIAGRLKVRYTLATGYSRKIFHFLIFITAFVLQLTYGISAVCLFGACTTLVIFFSVFRGDGDYLYEALARPKDEPHRTYFIIIPYLSTLIGGLSSNIFFGSSSIMGYLVTGLGDAAAEPVGTRYGKHVYYVPSLRSVRAIRSWEGTGAVFLLSLFSVFVAGYLSPEVTIDLNMIIFAAPLIAAASSIIEAFSPHGTDNFFLQFLVSGLSYRLIF